MTLYELKEKKAQLGAAIREEAEWIAAKAADPTVEIKDLESKQAHRDELQKRYDMLEAQEREMEAAEKAKLQPVKIETAKSMDEVKGEFYRDAIAGQVKKAYEGLGSIPANTADLGYGEKLLPTNMTRTLLTEPFEGNSVRTRASVTNIVNLVEPKLGFDYTGALADVDDFDAANEIALEGDTLAYGRFETRIKAKVADSVYYSSNVDLAATIDNAIREGLALKEGAQSFATADDGVHGHMSFYLNGIKAVAGATMVDAIMAALGDLSTRYREPVVYMTRQAYYGILRDLNGVGNELFTRKPEDVIGVPVIFHDKAIAPVVGDFNYYRINYEQARYEVARDIDHGMTLFVLAAIGDQRIRLKSAFRLPYVYTQILGATAAIESGDTGAPGDDIEVTAVTMNDGSTPDSGLTYQWQKFSGGSWTDLTSSYAGYHGAKLTTKATDGNASFRCVVTYSNGDDPASSAASNVITMLAGA